MERKYWIRCLNVILIKFNAGLRSLLLSLLSPQFSSTFLSFQVNILRLFCCVFVGRGIKESNVNRGEEM